MQKRRAARLPPRAKPKWLRFGEGRTRPTSILHVLRASAVNRIGDSSVAERKGEVGDL